MAFDRLVRLASDAKRAGMCSELLTNGGLIAANGDDECMIRPLLKGDMLRKDNRRHCEHPQQLQRQEDQY